MIQMRQRVEKFALFSAVCVLAFLTYLHFNFVGHNINCGCFLREMGVSAQQIKSHDIINIHISRDWPAVINGASSFDLQKYAPRIFEDFTGLLGLHYDEEKSAGSERVDSKTVLHAALQRFFQSTPSISTSRISERDFAQLSELVFDPSVPSLETFNSMLQDRVYLFSMEKGFLMLKQEKRQAHNITRLDVRVPTSSSCFGPAPLSWFIHNIIGYDTIVINLMIELFGGQGQLYNIYSKQLFNLNNAESRNRVVGEDHVSYTQSELQQRILFKLGLCFTNIFLFFTSTTLVSFILKQTQSRMLKFTFLLQHHVRNRLPYLPLVFTHVIESLVFVPIMIGILFFLFEFFADQLLAFLTLSLVWCCEVYSVMSVRTFASIQYYPKIIFLYFFLFHLYTFSFPYGFSYIALYASMCLDLHLMLYFFNTFEVPAYESGLITALRPRYAYPMSSAPLEADGLVERFERAPASHNTAETSAPLSFSNESEISMEDLSSDTPMEPLRPNQEDELSSDRSHTLGQVEYFSVDDETEGRQHMGVKRNRSFNTPLDEIIAYERAFIRRQQQIPSQGGKRMVGPSPSSASLSGNMEADEREGEETFSELGHPDGTGLCYGSGDEAAHCIEPELTQAELELSRQIQRQQMVAVMGFNLPTISPVGSRQVSRDSVLTAQSGDIIGSAHGDRPDSRSHSRSTSFDGPPSKRSSIGAFFSGIFSSKSNNPHGTKQTQNARLTVPTTFPTDANNALQVEESHSEDCVAAEEQEYSSQDSSPRSIDMAAEVATPVQQGTKLKPDNSSVDDQPSSSSTTTFRFFRKFSSPPTSPPHKLFHTEKKSAVPSSQSHIPAVTCSKPHSESVVSVFGSVWSTRSRASSTDSVSAVANTREDSAPMLYATESAQSQKRNRSQSCSDGASAEVNPAFRALLGRLKERLLSNSCDLEFNDSRKPEVAQSLKRSMSSPAIVTKVEGHRMFCITEYEQVHAYNRRKNLGNFCRSRPRGNSTASSSSVASNRGALCAAPTLSDGNDNRPQTQQGVGAMIIGGAASLPAVVGNSLCGFLSRATSNDSCPGSRSRSSTVITEEEYLADQRDFSLFGVNIEEEDDDDNQSMYN